MSTQQFFNEVLLAPLFWPGKTVRLERNTMVDFRQRSTSPQFAISELYHENSKLFPEMVPEMAACLADADAIRREFVERRAVVVRTAATGDFKLGKRYRALLTEATRSIPLDLFYAIELRIVSGGLLAVYEPVLDLFQVVKELSSSELSSLEAATHLLNRAGTEQLNYPLILVLGSFARNEILFGPRGYRRTLLEAGRVTESVISNANAAGITTKVFYEFDDRQVDAVMDADGVEQGTVGIVEFD